MSTTIGELRVHLDHLIRRQSIRYTKDKNILPDKTHQEGLLTGSEERNLRYADINDASWIGHIRKPDFQRETNAWTPQDCVEFLDSVVNARIIPSIILWQSQGNALIYVLDGAHRLSVVRAWMTDDWGDKAGSYYERRDQDLILEAAQATRELVRKKIGFFTDYAAAHSEMIEIVERDELPRQIMAHRYARALFYTHAMVKHQGLAIQWEYGNYESAEQSFLRINRTGQALAPWEATLIEYRHSSYARSVMYIANGGEDGHYWPPSSDNISADLTAKLNEFGSKAAKIHKALFVPPFVVPVSTLNVPLMVAPAYFQKHRYLLEVIPLLVDRKVAFGDDQQIEIMQKDVGAPAETIIRNGDRILSTIAERLEHLVSPTHSSTSLSLVPIFYWYNQKGQYVRGLLYGFLYWLLAGTDQDIAERKLLFSANRDRFEAVLFDLKQEISNMQERSGAGLRVTTNVAHFFNDLLALLHSNQQLAASSDDLRREVRKLLDGYANSAVRAQTAKSSRAYSTRDRSQINIRELFANSIRCHICSGVVNIQQGGVQYDHTQDYAQTHVTDPDTGKPTHPFCNRHKPELLAYRRGDSQKVALPSFKTEKTVEKASVQQELEFWGEDDFPG